MTVMDADQMADHQATAQGNLIAAHLDALTATPPHLPNAAVFHGSFSEPPVAAEDDVSPRSPLTPIRPGQSHPLGTMTGEAALGLPPAPVTPSRLRDSDLDED